MEQVKLYRPIKATFSSLRPGLGDNYGVIFDLDKEVTRKVMRVIVPGGWKWQLLDTKALWLWDYFVEVDQDVLDEIGMDLSLIERA